MIQSNILKKETFENVYRFDKMIETKSYTIIPNCLLEHIITHSDLTYQEKIYYLMADSLSYISYNKGNRRACSIPAPKWAEMIGCSRSRIFTMQKHLSEKGYFIIKKDHDHIGRNKRNIITTTIPDDVFQKLNKNNPNREGITDCKPGYDKRLYLDKTKLFIKINYKLLNLISSNISLNSTQKIIWIYFYAKSYKKYMLNKNISNFSTVTSYDELSKFFSFTNSNISKIMSALAKHKFIHAQNFHITNSNFDEFSDFSKKTEYELGERQDKSLWKITLALPNENTLCDIKNRSTIKENLKREDIFLSVNGHKINLNDNQIKSIENIINSNSEDINDNSNYQISQNEEDNDDDSNNNLHDDDINEKVTLKNQEINDNSNHSVKDIDSLRNSINDSSNSLLNKSFKTNINRSDKSNFKKNSFHTSKLDNLQSKLQKLNPLKQCYNGFLGGTKHLKDMLHYMTDDLCNILRKLSGREFSNRAIQQITQHLANKQTKVSFFHIKGFISYITKVLIHEKRNACNINNENFYILTNKSSEEVDIKHKEQYLTNIENTQQIDSLSRLQRKIAAVFERNKAYTILTSFNNIKIKNQIAQMNFNSEFTLTDHQKNTLLSQIKATYESINAEGLYEPITDLDIRFNNQNNQTNSSKNTKIPFNRRGIWGKIRASFAKLLYNGDNIDKSWLLKFNVKTDHNNKTIKLFAPNSFFYDYVKSNYLSNIQEAAKIHGFKIEYINFI